MPEQPQWPERTLDMPPQDPWADAPTAPEAYPAQHDLSRTQPYQGSTASVAPTSAAPSSAAPSSGGPVGSAPFSQGRAQVKSAPARPAFAEHEPTGTGWPGAPAPEIPAASWRWADLRRGGEWTTVAALFAFVCWGIWALDGGGDLSTPIIVYVVTMLVGVGVFCLARFVGHLVLERQLRRVRRTARGAHMVTGLYLAIVGVAFLREVPWVIEAFNWVKNAL